MKDENTFEKKKQAVLEAARAEGIADIVAANSKEDGVSIEMVELATNLVKKHRQTAYERLEARLAANK